MKSKNTYQSLSSQKGIDKSNWTNNNFDKELQNIKKPFLNRVQYSKLKIQSRIENFKNQKQALTKYEQIIKCLVQKLLENKLLPNHQSSQQKIDSEWHEDQTQKQISMQKRQNDKFQDDSEEESQHLLTVDSYLTQWPGRNKDRIFKNTTNMVEQYDKIFNKKLGTSANTKKSSNYSYRKDEKQMLQKIYLQLKGKNKNYVEFKSLFKFFDDCKLFLRVYGINKSQLEDVINCSAHKYPDKLTRQQFFQLFLVNCQSKNYDQFESKVDIQCCLDQQNWNQLKKVFNLLDTFGDGLVKTSELFHKMKTVSVSKQLLQSNVLHFTAINRYYNLSKILFVLQHKKSQPQSLTWSQFQSQIINFQHIQQPSIDEIYMGLIQKGIILKDSISFLLKQQTLSKLKQQFQRCPKFNEHFVKCKYFCQQLLGASDIKAHMKQYVRNNPTAKGLINLENNIKLLQIQGPQYFDLDQMLTYFSVKGFQLQNKLLIQRDSFDLRSTSSQQQFQQKKRQIKRQNRMKSQQHMKKIMRMTTLQSIRQQCGKQQKKPIFKPTVVEQFNLTKPRAQQTIRQKKLMEMLEQKQKIQAQQIKPFVKSNPIPVTNNGQKYQQDQQKYQMRRQVQRDMKQRQRQQDEKKLRYLMSNTKLFQKRNQSFQRQRRLYLSPQNNQQFEAKPISWFIKQKNLLEVIESQKQSRRKNRLKQTKQKYVFGYWKNMPYAPEESQMKKLTIVKHLEQNKSNDSLQIQLKQMDKALMEGQKKFRTTEVPDFSKLQRQFMQQLQSKKKMRSPTVIKQFKLSASKNKQPSNFQSIQKQIKHISPPKPNNLQSKRNSIPQNISIGTTKKYQSMVELNMMKMAQKKQEEHMKSCEQKQKKKKQKIFAKFMREAMKQQKIKQKQQKTNTKSQSQRTTRRNNKKQDKNHQQQLKKIYQRVLSRPFLFQSQQNGSVLKTNGGVKNTKKGMKNTGKHHHKAQKVKIPRQQTNQYWHQKNINNYDEFLNEYQQAEANYIYNENGMLILKNHNGDKLTSQNLILNLNKQNKQFQKGQQFQVQQFNAQESDIEYKDSQYERQTQRNFIKKQQNLNQSF